MNKKAIINTIDDTKRRVKNIKLSWTLFKMGLFVHPAYAGDLIRYVMVHCALPPASIDGLWPSPSMCRLTEINIFLNAKHKFNKRYLNELMGNGLKKKIENREYI